MKRSISAAVGLATIGLVAGSVLPAQAATKKTTKKATKTTKATATTTKASSTPATTAAAPVTTPASGQAPAKNTKKLKVEVPASLTGPNTPNSKPLARGVELAADEINAAGGIRVGDTAYTLDVHITDTGGDTNQAVAVARQALSNGTNILVTASTTAETLPVAELALTNSDMLMLSPSSGIFAQNRSDNPGRYPNVIANQVVSAKFRDCYVPTYLKQSGAKKVAILVPDNVTGQSLSKTLPPLFEAGQQTIVVLNELYAPDTTDFAPLLTKVKRADPDLVIVGYQPGPVSTLLKQARDIGVFHLAGTEGVYGDTVAKAMGAIPADFMWLHNLPALPASGKLADVWAKWKAKYGDDPAAAPDSNALVYLGYDAIMGMKASMEKTGSVKPADVVKGFSNLKYTGILDWNYDGNGVANVKMSIGQYKNGKPVYYACS